MTANNVRQPMIDHLRSHIINQDLHTLLSFSFSLPLHHTQILAVPLLEHKEDGHHGLIQIQISRFERGFAAGEVEEALGEFFAVDFSAGDALPTVAAGRLSRRARRDDDDEPDSQDSDLELTEAIEQDRKFWDKVARYLKVVTPLVKVLEWWMAIIRMT
ncbi:hypothetical protein Taro_044397 [Colocasia esculenta]|uniref:Uncharacterized protein n=1 Tax=Colocasia esculenta TaxID=4460 RepID=A0A843WLU0_COLES|nr:hypothetical protein [Colocasia esculenta]